MPRAKNSNSPKYPALVKSFNTFWCSFFSSVFYVFIIKLISYPCIQSWMNFEVGFLASSLVTLLWDSLPLSISSVHRESHLYLYRLDHNSSKDRLGPQVLVHISTLKTLVRKYTISPFHPK